MYIYLIKFVLSTGTNFGSGTFLAASLHIGSLYLKLKLKRRRRSQICGLQGELSLYKNGDVAIGKKPIATSP